jgi:hypothetical protein
MAWVLAGSWDHSVDGNTPSPLKFIDLAGAQDILVVARNVTCNLASNFLMRVSVDNGASFFATAGDYLSIDDAGFVSNSSGFQLTNVVATDARSGHHIIFGCNVNGVPKCDAMGPASQRRQFVASLLPINAVALAAANGGDFTGGLVQCLARF